MTDEQPAPQQGHFHQPDWKPDNVTQIAQQTVYNTYTGQTPPAADQKRHFFAVPFPRNDDFVGRELDLTNLHTALSDDASGEARPVGILPAGLTGQGGMGKTALAVEYCHRHRDDYPGGLFWVNAAESLAQGFAALGCVIDPANFDRPIPRQIDTAARYLNDHPDALLVLDNAVDPATLSRPVTTGLIPTELACRVLFTTRRRELPRRCRAVEVAVLPPDAALSLLLSQREGAQALTGPEQAITAEICAILGYLPLALEIAAAHLRRPRLSLTQYRDALLERGALAVVDDPKGRVSADDLTTRHTAAVAATLDEQWVSLESEDARLLLRVAGQLPEAAQIPVARLGLLAGISDEEDIFGSPLEVAVIELENASLIEKLQADELRLHPLVQEFAARQTPTGESEDFRVTCAENLHRAYSDFVTLEGHCACRGVAALEGDIRTALALIALQHGDDSFLSLTLRVLQLESHNLRHWNIIDQPVLFARRINYQAALRGPNLLTQIAARRLIGIFDCGVLFLNWQTERIATEMLRVLTGHKDGVLSVAVTPDGRRAISASADCTLRAWDLESGIQEYILTGHEGAVWSAAVTPDGTRAVSASADRTLRVWNLQSAAQERILIGHDAGVRSAAVTPDGSRVVSASNDRTLRLWNMATGIEERRFIGHEGRVRSVAVTPDGRRVISASEDRTLRVWNLESGLTELVLVGHEDTIWSVAVTSDGRWAISASNDRTLRVWNLENGKEERILTGHASFVLSVAVTPDGLQAVSTSDDHTLRVWDLQSGYLKRILAGHEDWVNAVSVTPNGQCLLSASDDSTLRMWDISMPLNKSLETGKHEQVLNFSDANVNIVAVTNDGVQAVSVSDNGTLRMWDLKKGVAGNVLTDYEGSIRLVTATPEGLYAVSTSDDRTLRVWNLKDRTVEQVLDKHHERIDAISVAPDGKYLLSGSDDGALRMWNFENGAEEWRFTGHEYPISLLVGTPDGRQVVFATQFGLLGDYNLRVWDWESSSEQWVLTGHKDWVLSAVVTPDGRRAVSSSSDHTLRVWNLKSGAEERALIGHDDGVNTVAVTPDGRRVVSASSDRTLRVWNIETGDELAQIDLDSAVTAVTVAPNGTTIVAGDAGGNVYCLEYVEPRMGGVRE